MGILLALSNDGDPSRGTVEKHNTEGIESDCSKAERLLGWGPERSWYNEENPDEVDGSDTI